MNRSLTLILLKPKRSCQCLKAWKSKLTLRQTDLLKLFIETWLKKRKHKVWSNRLQVETRWFNPSFVILTNKLKEVMEVLSTTGPRIIQKFIVKKVIHSQKFRFQNLSKNLYLTLWQIRRLQKLLKFRN